MPEKLGQGALLLQQGEIVNAMRENSALVRTIAQVAPASAAPTDEDALFIGVHIIRETAALCHKLECPMVFALTPTLPELFDSASVTRYDGMSRVLEQFLKQEQIPYVDLRPAFIAEEDQASRLFLEEAFHHYSEAGNAIVARELHAWLRQVVPEYGSR